MSLATLQHTAQTTPAPAIMDGKLDAQMRLALDRMRGWCERNPMGQAIIARGFVVDSTKDLISEITEYFPGIDVSPIVDDVAFFIADNAQNSGQRFQQVKFHYIADGKKPELDDASFQTTFKVYTDNGTHAPAFSDFTKDYKMAGGGSGGGNANDLLAVVTAGLVKYFLLEVTALDIEDGRAQQLLADLPIMQAFGANPAALRQATETMAKGGADAAQLQGAIEQIIEIKTLRAALTNTDSPAVAAALAMKTENFSSTMQTMKAPEAVKIASANTVETVRIDLTARQIESVVSVLSATTPAMAAVEAIAHTHHMPVRDAIALTLSHTASPEISAPVRAMTEMMVKPDFMLRVESTQSPAVAQAVRKTLTTPVLQAVAETPIPMPAVAQNIAALAQKTDLPTLQMAAVALQIAGQPVAIEAVAPALRAPQLQAIADNLQALALTQSIPAHVKPELMIVTAQVETLAVQARAPETPQPTQALPQNAPLIAMAEAMNIPAPTHIAPSTLPPEILGGPKVRGDSPNNPAPDIKHTGGGEYKTFSYAPDQIQPRFDFGARSSGSPSSSSVWDNRSEGIKTSPFFTPQKAEVRNDGTGGHINKPNDKPKGPGCGDKVCMTCFNKTCMATAPDFMAAMTTSARTDVLSDYFKPKLSL